MVTQQQLPHVIGVFPIAEVRTGGHRRYIELTQTLCERGYAVVHLSRARTHIGLSGTVLPVVPGFKPKFVPLSAMFAIACVWRIGRVRRVLRCKHRVVLSFGETNVPAALCVAILLRGKLVHAVRSNAVLEERLSHHAHSRRSILARLRQAVRVWKKIGVELLIRAAGRAIVVQSRYDRRNLVCRSPIGRSRIRVIPNNIGTSWMPLELSCVNRSTQCLRIVFVGGLNTRKGADILVRAFARAVTMSALDLRLTIVGDGALLPWIRMFVAEHGIQDRVALLGPVWKPLSIVAAHDLMVVPSRHDSFPNVVLEALFVGTPVFGAATSGIREMLEHERLLFPLEDSTTLSKRILDVVNDPKRYQQVRALCGLRRQVHDFDWAARWGDVFSALFPGVNHADR